MIGQKCHQGGGRLIAKVMKNYLFSWALPLVKNDKFDKGFVLGTIIYLINNWEKVQKKVKSGTSRKPH